MLCQYAEAFGVAGQGLHRLRVPGTSTAAFDFLLTILVAWGIAAGCQLPLVPMTVGLFLLGSLLHKLFCVT